MFEQYEACLIYGAAGSFKRGHTTHEMGIKCSHIYYLDKFLNMYYTLQLQMEKQ